MISFSKESTALIARTWQTVWIEPWGRNSFRVRCHQGCGKRDLPGALEPAPPPGSDAAVVMEGNRASIQNGVIRAEVDSNSFITFKNSSTGETLLQELQPRGRHFAGIAGDVCEIQARFKAWPDEKFYGLGQHRHGFLDQKGCVIPLRHRAMEISVPFMVSNRGYGFLWNNPAIGEVTLANNCTQWVARQARQIDYFVTAGSYKEIMAQYGAATGLPPEMPAWATGFWQSKLRYETQEELLQVAREYKKRGLPLDVIVIDYYHWTRMGDFQFDPAEWPDPSAMVKELDKMGVRVLVSVWPTINHKSKNAREMLNRSLIVKSRIGEPVHRSSFDKPDRVREYMHFYDPTNPEARAYVWDKVKQGYYRHGIKMFWLDACEPQLAYDNHENMQFHEGPGAEVALLYPLRHQQTFFEGLRAEGETEIVNLCRAAWAGSQKFGALIWSGDVPSTFESLREQIPAGLNMAMSGIPWWNTDIGGFQHGDPDSPVFRELLVRWFQYAVFTPALRLHGVREPSTSAFMGGPNELWSFGDEVYEILRDLLFMRERLKAYILEQMREASRSGLPPMRPLFVDFPDDNRCYDIADAFLFGQDILVAPVTEYQQRQRDVYLPRSATWTDPWSSKRYEGGQTVTVDAPLKVVPVFLKNDAEVPLK